ncbi:MAG TPA: Ig-like domain-containing protein [Gemmatimonadaceae bacterium]|nr:Ig-like domain-containing protein [Gemmatimonadaceae bacterium]
MALLSIACDKEATATGGNVATIEVTPSALSLSPGLARSVVARALDESGSQLGGPIYWSTQDVQVATVSSTGVVTGVRAGSTQIAASKGGVSAVVPVNVSSLPAAVVRISPTSANLNIGATIRLTAQVLDAGGSIMSGQNISWQSENAAVASVSSTGTVTGLTAGNALITARAAGLSGTAVVSVQRPAVANVVITPNEPTVQVGKSIQLTATPRDASGQNLTGRTVTWSSSNLARAIVSSSGLVTGVTKGSVNITATCEGKSSSVSLSVR